MRARLSEFFSTPGRQAAGWTTLGVLGLLLALGGALLIFDEQDASPKPASSGTVATATATPARGGATPGARASASPSPTASPSPSPTSSPSPSPAPSATPAPASQQSGSTSGGSDPPPPAPTPTPPPVAAGGPYCDNSSSTAPPNSLVGFLTIGEAPAPAGTIVSLAFDGVIGPSRATTAAGGYRVDWSAGGDGCANRFGALIAVVVNGQSFASPFTVGSSGGNPLQRFDVAAPAGS